MRISVNLASRPFVELRPLFARLRLVMGMLTLLAVALTFWLVALNRQAKIATAEMDALVARTQGFEQERARNEAKMLQPQNRAVLERSQFLNALFARKSFSWTAVMMDLERVLPTGVQVTSIEPVISKEGDVSIRLRVTGDRDRAIQLVRNLEGSQRFLGPRLAGESALAADKARALSGLPPAGGAQTVSAAGGPSGPLGNAVEFEIFSGYNPLPETRRVETRAEAEAKGDYVPDEAQPVVHHNRKPGAVVGPVAPKPGGAR